MASISEISLWDETELKSVIIKDFRAKGLDMQLTGLNVERKPL